MSPSDTEERDHGVHLPATDDWPRGYGDASWVPIVTTLGMVGIMGGLAIYIIGSNVPAIVDPIVGIIVSVTGLAVAVGGLAAWVYGGFIMQYREKSIVPHEKKYLWGLLLYLPVEFALVGAGLLYYTMVRSWAWPPGDLPPVFTPLVWVMTGLIVASALTTYFSERALEKGNRRRFLVLHAATPILGILFLVGKAANFSRLVGEGYTLESGPFWSAFYGLSGLHGLLVTVGIVFMLVTLGRALAGHYTADNHLSVTTSAWYWWVIDAIWLLLLVEIYATAFLCRSAGQC